MLSEQFVKIDDFWLEVVSQPPLKVFDTNDLRVRLDEMGYEANCGRFLIVLFLQQMMHYLGQVSIINFL